MTKNGLAPLVFASACAIASLAGGPARADQQGSPTGALRELSAASQACITCHKKDQPAIYQQWGSGKH